MDPSPKAREVKGKINKWDLKLKAFAQQNKATNWKIHQLNGKIILQMMWLVSHQYPKFIDSSCNSILKKRTQLKSGQKTQIDVSQRRYKDSQQAHLKSAQHC